MEWHGSNAALRKAKDAVNRRVDREAERSLVEKHFQLEVSACELCCERKHGSLNQG